MRTVRAGDVLSLQRRSVAIDAATEYRLAGVYSFGKGIFHREPKLGADLGNYKYFAIEPGDLLLSNIQAWEGAIGFATASDDGVVGTHRFLSYTAKDPDEIDTNWARYLFLSEAGFPLIQKAAPGSVTRNRTLAVERFEALEIPLPGIDEQRRVAAHLDRVATWAATLTQAHEQSAIRLAALVPSLAMQPTLTEERRRSAGWQRRRLGDAMEPVKDTLSVEATGVYPNLGIYSFGRGLFEKPPIEGTNTSAKVLNRVRAGQFIYSRLFAFEGSYSFVPAQFDGYFVSGEFPTFDVDPEVTSAEFIAASLRSPRAWEDLRGSSRGLGLRRQRVQVESLLAYEMWFPPAEVQQRLVAGTEKSAEALQHLERAQRLTGALVPSALNQAFAGLA